MRRRGEGNWKEETRSIYLLNVFRAFVGGVCRVPTGNTRRLKECCRIQRGRESPRFRQDTEGSTKVASLNGITTCYVVAPTSGKETRKLTSSCIYIYTYLFFSLSPPIFPSRACRVLGNTGSRRGGDEKKRGDEDKRRGRERPADSFFLLSGGDSGSPLAQSNRRGPLITGCFPGSSAREEENEERGREKENWGREREGDIAG